MNWEEEQPCFEGIATEIGLFYSDLSSYYQFFTSSSDGEEDSDPEKQGGTEEGGGKRGDSGGGQDAAAGGGEGGTGSSSTTRDEGATGPVPKKYEYLLQVCSCPHCITYDLCLTSICMYPPPYKQYFYHIHSMSSTPLFVVSSSLHEISRLQRAKLSCN